jgi:hypothetical protein
MNVVKIMGGVFQLLIATLPDISNFVSLYRATRNKLSLKDRRKDNL